jgi:hypothetical protein
MFTRFLFAHARCSSCVAVFPREGIFGIETCVNASLYALHVSDFMPSAYRFQVDLIHRNMMSSKKLVSLRLSFCNI